MGSHGQGDTFYNSAPDFRVLQPEAGSAIATAYLDLDGVIYPIEPFSDGADMRDIAFEGDEYGPTRWWRPSIVKRLGELPLNIVMSSSWGEVFISSTFLAPTKDVLRPTSALSQQHIQLTSKEATIAHSILAAPTPGPFVMLEDAMDVTQAAEVLGGEIPYLLIKPDSMVGLTDEHIERVEEFIYTMQERAQA